MHSATVAVDKSTGRAAAERLATSTCGERVLRAGLAARGVVFMVLAYLVACVALGALGAESTSKPASLTGVPTALTNQPGGRTALVLLGVGLGAYALFSLVDAILHHDDEAPAVKRWGDRALSVWGFIMYAAFSAYCLGSAASGGHRTSGQEDAQKAQWSAKVLRWPGGRIWLGLFATVLLIMTAFLVGRAARRSFRPRLRRAEMSRRTWRLALSLGTLGYLGRAGLFGVVGGCVMIAATENDPDRGQGVDGSLRILAHSTAGRWLLWVLVAMLGAYGLYVFIEARYRRV